jgi:hypothetical protein
MDKNKSDYAVGYKKPPRHTQFKPGKSGNPKGRPKHSMTFADLLQEQLSKNVTVTVGNEVRKMPLLEAIAIKHASKAASGDPKSTQIVLRALEPNEQDQGNNLPEVLQQFRSIHESRKASERVSSPANAPLNQAPAASKEDES